MTQLRFGRKKTRRILSGKLSCTAVVLFYSGRYKILDLVCEVW
jgi:hypothetical protein